MSNGQRLEKSGKLEEAHVDIGDIGKGRIWDLEASLVSHLPF